MKYEAFDAQFGSELGTRATKSIYRLRMATAGLLLTALVLEALLWLISGPRVAFWVIVIGGFVLALTVVFGLRDALSKASTYQSRKVTIGDLAKSGALVSGRRPTNQSSGGSTN